MRESTVGIDMPCEGGKDDTARGFPGPLPARSERYNHARRQCRNGLQFPCRSLPFPAAWQLGLAPFLCGKTKLI